jgi:hypothetical protein
MQQLFRTAVLAWAAMLLAWGTDAALADRRVALVIGNSAYQNVPSLPNPARDARAMADMFRKVGFDVVSAQYDIGNLDLKRAIRQFEDAAVDADIAVVYYAGHGIEINGVNYLIPVDAKLASDRDAEDEAVTLERLIGALDGATRLRLVILDACRDSPFVRTMKQQRQTRGISGGLGAAEPRSINTLIAYAAKAGSVATDGNGDHSPFTAALLNNLFTPGLDIRLAFGRVRDEVLKMTARQQEPFVYGSLGGANFALVPAAPVGPAPEVVDAAAQADYNLVKKIGTKTAWEVFLKQYPTGFYHDLAQEQLAMVLAPDKNIHDAQSGNISVVTRNVQPEQQRPPQGTPAIAAAAPNGQPQALLWWWPQWR